MYMNVVNAFTQKKTLLVGPSPRRRLFATAFPFSARQRPTRSSSRTTTSSGAHTTTGSWSDCHDHQCRLRSILLHPPAMVPPTRGGTILLSKQLQYLPFQQQQVRHLMDAKLRPSHSGMFPSASPSTPSAALVQIPHDEPQQEWFLSLLLLQRACMAMGIVYVLTEYVADITLCEGPSMSPTIRPCGEIVLVDKYCLRNGLSDGESGAERHAAARQRQDGHREPEEWHAPHVSVTELQEPQEQQNFTWRNAWLHLRSPIAIGDVVVTQHPSRPGTVCKRVTGLPGDQILRHTTTTSFSSSSSDGGGRHRGIETVPDGHVWLEGDNPGNSSDSRMYGPLPVALLQGRVVARIWPVRGQAWMRRGARPTPQRQQQQGRGYNSGSTVLPAGYQGEHIVKHLRDPQASKETTDAEPTTGKQNTVAAKRGTSS